MIVALGVQSRCQFVRSGPGAAALAGVVSMRSQPTLRHSGRSGGLSVRGAPDLRCCYPTANAVGAGSYTWRGRHSTRRVGLGRW
jgi:hypothetical protein